MKNPALVLFPAVVALAAMFFPFPAAGAPAQEGGVSFKDVEGKEWMLSGVESAGKNTAFDRKKLEDGGMAGFFTVSFREGQAAGTGAPNRYTGPYTAGANRALSIGNLAGTKMLALREPDGLNETGYFTLLSGVTRWDLKDGQLWLYGLNADGSATSLVFTRQ